MRRQPGKKKNHTGRESQKNRTRMALIEAAGTLMRDGHSPTVGEAAAAAEISRATAYRYFPTQELLLAEVALFSAGGPLFPADADADRGAVPEAVARLARRVGTWTLANEQPLRTLLRLSLDPASGVRRPGHRVDWIEAALSPLVDRIDAESYRRLSQALTLLLGIDPVVVMRDIAGVSGQEAIATLEWSARVLVEAAIGDGKAKRG